ncbi:MAG: glycerol-3-phosphate acyltransferase [Caldibacillus debilis]|jgi:glycerol-3-phosphate acyltransferase PlsY|uniref:Glycerol-3-phosphate acyltransferase n=3 Tax=Caldibacillus debilis TaxID=301148 RepID=A0A420VKQ7_9BACI|nr:glycerol-3-phosphate 1-O-acyltransferase PlsY [Caldibacillus debilis]MBO2481760.1 glycerol-3-phosphate acyltransferase [Bacillaceae bacterium]MBY6271387.1 glycerol-3-phosphate acyltransferase [Bacillaceae bacterium]REJ18155.1 MAG: glycerol-3-phosphate acyltransferase [Caldibacillus debilis]REJ27900.1 MAG: glycerol-3-phosphate acyltransferase [Caldibacillus debilis]REJ30348.1 MAG: glycerol-3-phosphate acyltransferase [Caldibacillus debilis]
MYGILPIIAYLLGSIPSGLIIGKVFYKTDIREHGSGNLGATNTFRVLGVKAGLVVTFADILKGTLSAALPAIFHVDMHPLFVGLFAVLGHTYPLFAGFRGGKAVATSGGIMLFYQPLIFFLLVLTFFITLYFSKYVSLSSMVTSVVAMILTLFTKDWPLIVIVFFLAALIIYRHRANIERIKKKTEPKIKWL